MSFSLENQTTYEEVIEEINIQKLPSQTLSSATLEFRVSVPSSTPSSFSDLNNLVSRKGGVDEVVADEKVSSATSPLLQKNSINEMNYNSLDIILEREKQTNKNDNWNKIDKTEKIQKLHIFAEKYGKSHNLSSIDIKNMKTFFIESLEKMKLQKTKDVVYDKETREITSIPALFFNINTHNFTLRNMDNKRVSTLKSLTPKRISNKNKESTAQVGDV